jgi:hypothetical protein
VIEVGPFQALLDPATDMIWLNYAVPISPIDPPSVAAALVKLRQIFAQHNTSAPSDLSLMLCPG